MAIDLENKFRFSKKMNFNNQDRKLLDALQRDSSLPLGELANSLGMSQSTVWRRVKEFEETGLITARVALLDPTKTGVGLCVLANVTLHDHTEEAVSALENLVSRHPEIQECYTLSGVADYQMKIRVTDVAAYEAFMSQNLLRHPHIRSVQSSFVLKEIKSTTALPL